METIVSESWIVLGIIALVVMAAAGGWVFHLEQRLSKLRQAFAEDYSRIVDHSATRPTLSHG